MSSYFLCFTSPLLQVFLEAESVVVAEPEAFALLPAAAELSPEVVVLDAEPGVVFVAVVAEPEAFALLPAAAELSPEVVVLVVEPEAVFLVYFEVSEPGVVFVAVASAADAPEPPASVDIPVAFVVLLRVSVVVVEVDSPARPKSLAFPNVDYFATPASSVEVAGHQFVHNTSGAHANYDLCSILSNLSLHQNKTLEHGHNKPSRGHSNVTDTNDRAMGATTSHSKKTSLSLYQEQRKHSTYQATLSQPEVLQI